MAGVEAAGEQRVGAEFGRASVELAGVAEDQSGAAMEGLDDAADLDVHVAVFLELADFVVVFPRADDGESAGVVGGLRGADVEEAGSVWKFDNVIDMRGDADVFIEVLLGVFYGDAGFGFGGVGG